MDVLKRYEGTTKDKYFKRYDFENNNNNNNVQALTFHMRQIKATIKLS